MAAWSPSSWRSFPRVQIAEFEDKAAADKVFQRLSRLPPLVHAAEVDALKALLAQAGRGQKFVVTGGDCAERFVDCQAERLEAQLELILRMSVIVGHVTGTPAVPICRIAGQYSKPRSKPTEVVEGFGEIMSFKGDNLNSFSPEDRRLDPDRLVQGYFHSAAALNFLRGSFAAQDPARLLTIDVESLKPSEDYAQISSDAAEIKAKGATSALPAKFFTAHEAMQLDFEECFTRPGTGGRHYNLSAHFVWIGDRTRQLDMAHVEYFKGIANPIGVKVGPSMKAAELQELVKALNPNKEEGRLMLITRYGVGKVEEFLPGHIEAVRASGVPVVWQCDCVHGNGVVAESNKLKTRRLTDILAEAFKCIAVHRRCGSVLGGLHVECTAQDVTECLGGAAAITEEGLLRNYETYCDPRLNGSQSIEAAFKVAYEMQSEERAAKRPR